MTVKHRYRKASQTHPEGGCWGWLSVVGLFLMTFFTKGSAVAHGIFFISFIDYFNESAANTSWILALMGSLTWMASPISAVFAKKYGARKVAMVGATVLFVSLVMSQFSTQIWHLIVTFGFLQGFSYGTVNPVVVANLAKYFKRRHPLASGLGFCGVGIGSLVLPPLFQFCIDTYGWRGALLVYAGMSANIFISAALIVSIKLPKLKNIDTPTPSEELDLQPYGFEDEGITEVDEEDTSIKESPLKSRQQISCSSICNKCCNVFNLTMVKKYPMYVLLTVSQSIASVGIGVSLVHLAPLVQGIVISKSVMAKLLSINGIGILLGSPIFGFLLSHFQLNKILFMSTMYFLYAVTLVLLTFTSSPGPIIPLIFVVGLVRIGFAGQFNVSIRSTLPDSSFITGLGWALLLSSFGQLIGPIISGYLRDFTGSYDWSFYFAGILLTVCSLMLLIGNFLLKPNPSNPVQLEEHVSSV